MARAFRGGLLLIGAGIVAASCGGGSNATGLLVENGQPKTYASIYLWNQPENENNHTPAWDVFKIPPSPPQ